MARYGKSSSWKPQDIVRKAVAFFGPGGAGLDVKEEGPCCAHFEGGGGHVSLDIREGETGSEIDLETREWDYQVKEFMKRI